MSGGNGANMITEAGPRIVQRVESTSAFRVPPHSADAEMGVLGSMLISPREAIGECIDKLTPEHFFIPAHQTIYSALLAIFESGCAIDLITFTDELRSRNLLDTVGGAPAVTNLFTFVPTAANIQYYIDIVRDKHVLRSIIAGCTECVRRAYEDPIDIAEVLDSTQATITGLAMDNLRDETSRHWSDAIELAVGELENAYKHRGDEVVNGLATGFHDLDRILTGMKPQQFITIAGLTSHGKSAVGMNIAEHAAIKLGVPVGIWSMEMSYEELGRRVLASTTSASLQRFRDGFLKKEDLPQITAKALKVAPAPVYIDDDRGLSINDFKARARRLALKRKLGLIIVDYVQLMHSQSKRAIDNRAREVAEITGGLKSIAKELRIPVIGLAQLSREADKRAETFRRPKLSDLKESSSIEQDSDVVIFVWRPARFVQTDDDRVRLEKNLGLEALNEKFSGACRRLEEVDGESVLFTPLTVKNYVELIVAKQRNGPVSDEHNRIRLRFESDLTRFENVTPKMWSNNFNERQT